MWRKHDSQVPVLPLKGMNDTVLGGYADPSSVQRVADDVKGVLQFENCGCRSHREVEEPTS